MAPQNGQIHDQLPALGVQGPEMDAGQEPSPWTIPAPLSTIKYRVGRLRGPSPTYMDGANSKVPFPWGTA